ncbi:MAG: class I SAM-dependent methyltransferase [Actinobacteria bacterium]|nr:class I SAM-dependent methyltransferase [Actinomycetota bacterium]MBU1945070.1 class I SAM-dependent methyltransferase [Actinomycetota bacterium]MBU2688338.1 class I SAM-dependent methyltransferase [Actinomycetota bacterium]
MNIDEYRIMRDIEDDFWWYVGFRRIFAAFIERYCAEQVAGRVLDAGCGTGAFLEFLADRYRPEVLVGADFSPEALSFCGERGFNGLVQCSVVELPFDDDSFDLVTSFDVLCHKSIRDDVVPMREFARVLRPGGRLLLNLPAFMFLYSEHDRAVHTARRYTRKELECKLLSAGLEPLVVTYTNLFLFPPTAAVKVVRNLLGSSGDHRSDLVPVPAALNRALAWLLGLESHLVGRVTLPFGTSATALARRI